MRVLAPLAFLGTILAANYATSRYGLVPVGFGLTATAGTWFAGAACMSGLNDQDARALTDTDQP